MAKVKNCQRNQIREWFCPSPGYVLDFTNRSFAEFFDDHFDINIYADVFSDKGTSKYNRLLAFIELSPPHIVIELLNLLWARKNVERDNEIERALFAHQSDEWGTSVEYIEALGNAAALENLPFEKFISELANLPSHSAAPHLERISAEWTLDTVEREFQRAFENAESDPEAAITAACSMLESLFRSILLAREISPPKSLDVKSLYKEVRDPLGLSPAKNMPESEIDGDVRAILSALANAVQGIGALRSHAGTAHGRERGFQRVDPRISRLAVNSSMALALFVIETWEKRFPTDKLSNA